MHQGLRIEREVREAHLRAPDDAADRDGDLHRNWLVGGDSLTEQWIRYQENVVRTDRRRRLQPKNVTQIAACPGDEPGIVVVLPRSGLQ